MQSAECGKMATKTASHSSSNSSRRTHRACDRCRVKKSKCNGQQPCNTCKVNERTCVFSALRRRDIRKWHCRMQDTIDEAIQRLYRACRDSASFPGILPEEREGFVTTESILHGMGFTNLDLGPSSGDLVFPDTLRHSPSSSHGARSHYNDSSSSSQPYSSDSHAPLTTQISPTVAPRFLVPINGADEATRLDNLYRYPPTPSVDSFDHFSKIPHQQAPANDFVYAGTNQPRPAANTEFKRQMETSLISVPPSMPPMQGQPILSARHCDPLNQHDTNGYYVYNDAYYVNEQPRWSTSHVMVSMPQE